MAHFKYLSKMVKVMTHDKHGPVQEKKNTRKQNIFVLSITTYIKLTCGFFPSEEIDSTFQV